MDWIDPAQDRDQWRALVDTVMNLIKVGWGGVDGIDLAQDRDQWRALVHTVINLIKIG
jgi:hypothetical protein